MKRDVDVLHHIGLIGSDLHALVARYEALGFHFTPLSVPKVPLSPGGTPEPLGVGNRCAIFEDNYLELLGVVDEARWSRITPEQRGPFDIDRPRQRYEGLHVMHFGADDLTVVGARLAAEGVAASEIRPFQRMVDTIDGPRMMRAQCISFSAEANPEALLQIAQHLTPELIFQQRYMEHPNGARNVREIFVCTEDVAGLAAKYTRYTGHRSEVHDGYRVVDLGRSRVIVLSPRELEIFVPGFTPPAMPMLAGFVVEADLSRTEQVLHASGIPFAPHREGWLVRPEHACGSAVFFTSAAKRGS